MSSIRVLIVDDDKLVRKGLISAMPWAEFGMEVVGEANHGEKALEFMGSHPVDLLLTDLAMPVMSGIELMREVRKRYPQIHIVVLTLHQDFEYIQEALRLGAIDYIAKVQLEKERFDQVLGRIAERIRESSVSVTPDPRNGRDAKWLTDRGYVLLAPKHAEALEETELGPSLSGGTLSEAGLNTYLWLPADEAAGEGLLKHWTAALQDGKDWSLIELNGLRRVTRKEALAWLQRYRERDFFYDYAPGDKALIREVVTQDKEGIASKDGELLAGKAEENLTLAKADWSTPDWVRQDTVFTKLVEGLKQLRLPEVKLIGLLYSLIDEWNRLFGPLGMSPIAFPDALYCWHDTVSWLHATRDHIRQALQRSTYSQEVVEAVMKAKQLMHEELDQAVTAADMARRVLMSRGYFSQCFKDVIGRTFNDYLRHIRMEKAKELLLYTHKPIHWIAEQTGYSDEKYFSRTFREHTGILPSEYRQTHRGGQETGRELSGK
ncbi:response regulator [Paenibacillus silviterrae]|uniref:response regulator n=1 Tax=Paenibacillus silviterrae TaxID=3242194 RepID=UPI002543A866|nr:response regulator [Paenibacillus chinjuensis]